MNEVVQLNIQISQGSAATNLRCGGRFYRSYFCSSSQNITEKELIKIGLVHVCQSYHKQSVWLILTHVRCIKL